MHLPARHAALRSRFILSFCAFLAEALHLGWEYSHGGVAAHHPLNDASLPAISNWWGLLVVPLLVWFALGRINRRAATLVQAGSRERFATLVRLRFALALGWGGALALAFSYGHPAVNVFFIGAFVIAPIVHGYRAEYLLGFALGMTFTFGAVLPVLVGGVIALFAWLARLLVGALMRLARGGRVRGAGLP
ncbi:MAG: hypothetical protein AB1437_07220 [Pseudomonadota bacterium]